MIRRRCPVAGCKANIPRSFAMCSRHWYLVPANLRGRIWQLFRKEPRSEEHLRALDEARQIVEGRESAAAPRGGV